MESSSLNIDFQTQLKQIRFKTYFHNRAEMPDYESLFDRRRVAVFSIPQVFSSKTFQHFKSFTDNYNHLLSLGIDDVYAVNSTELIAAPWADKHSKHIKGLVNIDQQFIKSLANFYQLAHPLKDLSNNWQFITVINCGVPEKLWYVPFKANMPWMAIKNDMWRYRNLKVDQLIEYLKQPVDNTV